MWLGKKRKKAGLISHLELILWTLLVMLVVLPIAALQERCILLVVGSDIFTGITPRPRLVARVKL